MTFQHSHTWKSVTQLGPTHESDQNGYVPPLFSKRFSRILGPLEYIKSQIHHLTTLPSSSAFLLCKVLRVFSLSSCLGHPSNPESPWCFSGKNDVTDVESYGILGQELLVSRLEVFFCRQSLVLHSLRVHHDIDLIIIRWNTGYTECRVLSSHFRVVAVFPWTEIQSSS